MITLAELKSAIDNKEFRLVYQPKIDVASRRVIGFEALARWDHPKTGMVMPDNFIPEAEKVGVIGELTDALVDQLLSWYSTTESVQGLSVSLNVAASSLKDESFVGSLVARGKQAGLLQSPLILEFPEEVVLSNSDQCATCFAEFRAAGFGVSIDHFGLTGHHVSSLVPLGATEVKVDKSIAISDWQSADARHIIRSACEEGNTQGVIVVVEGVEEPAMLEFLTEVGCKVAQGYCISPPLAANLVVDWMNGYHHSLEQDLV